MSGTSAAAGYLAPSGTIPTDASVASVLQRLVVGITGLAGSLVRPRWQPLLAQQPARDVAWCAIGVLALRPDENGHVTHAPAGQGTDKVRLHWTLESMASFYGPTAQALAMRLKMGLLITQNRALLRENGWGVREANEIRHVPELVNGEWLNRVDMPMQFRLEIVTDFAVLTLLSAAGTITDPPRIQPFNSQDTIP